MTEFSIETLIDIYTRELSSRKLVELPEFYHKDAVKLIASLRQEATRGDPLQRELAEEELKIVMTLLRKIHAARVSKALSELEAGRTPLMTLEEERARFMEMRESLEKLTSEILEQTMKGAIDLSAPATRLRTPAIFLMDLGERLAGADAKFYGPFRKGELVNMPEWNVNLLEKHGYLKRVKIKV